jgi:tRNA(fMet)-specific endonuclease VapC
VTRYLPDTDTVNYLLRSRPLVVERYTAALASNAVFILSPIVRYEIVRYLLLRRATSAHRAYDRIVSDWDTVELVGDDWRTAAELWSQRHRAGRPIEDTDLLIAVTARKAGAVLVTNNTSHFDGLGLTVENWILPL